MSAGTVNKVILIGNLGRDPEIRTTQDGREIANIIIATSEHWTDRTSGERRERTEWHRVVIFNPNLVKLLKEYVKKGTKVYVEGQLHTRKWQDAQTGQDRYATEVVVQGYNGSISFLSKANDSRQSARDSANEYAAATRAQYQASNDTDLDDEIPF